MDQTTFEFLISLLNEANSGNNPDAYNLLLGILGNANKMKANTAIFELMANHNTLLKLQQAKLL